MSEPKDKPKQVNKLEIPIRFEVSKPTLTEIPKPQDKKEQ